MADRNGGKKGKKMQLWRNSCRRQKNKLVGWVFSTSTIEAFFFNLRYCCTLEQRIMDVKMSVIKNEDVVTYQENKIGSSYEQANNDNTNNKNNQQVLKCSVRLILRQL